MNLFTELLIQSSEVVFSFKKENKEKKKNNRGDVRGQREEMSIFFYFLLSELSPYHVTLLTRFGCFTVISLDFFSVFLLDYIFHLFLNKKTK